MNKLKKNELGFGAVEGILILVIVLLIGVVGWFVYKNQNKAISSTSATTSKTASSPVKTPTIVDPYAGWTTYISKAEKVSYKYPSDWKSVTPSLE